eukprot:893907-Prorocentrum_minimum.AAC.1
MAAFLRAAAIIGNDCDTCEAVFHLIVGLFLRRHRARRDRARSSKSLKGKRPLGFRGFRVGRDKIGRDKI